MRVIGTVDHVDFLTSTSNANPRADVTFRTLTGELTTHRTMSDASVAYGIDNPEYRERPRVWNLTDTGRVRRIDTDATSALWRLTSAFPRGARVHTITTGRAVRVLAVEDGEVFDVSYAVADLTNRRANRRTGGILVPGVGVEPAAALVSALARHLHGDGAALVKVAL